jgi:hypothetical protein
MKLPDGKRCCLTCVKYRLVRDTGSCFGCGRSVCTHTGADAYCFPCCGNHQVNFLDDQE